MFPGVSLIFILRIFIECPRKGEEIVVVSHNAVTMFKNVRSCWGTSHQGRLARKGRIWPAVWWKRGEAIAPGRKTCSGKRKRRILGEVKCAQSSLSWW